MSLPINQLIGCRYVATKPIGSGGVCDIYAANDTYTHKPVALKIIKDNLKDDSETVNRFENEARYTAMFSHPNIIKIYNIGEYKNHMFIAYEIVKGTTLKDVLDRRGHLSPDEVIDYSLQLLQAMKHIHSRDILHNDIKPDNLFLQYDGNLKLSDFGLASHVNDQNETKVFASVKYTAPEILRGARCSIQSDIYSFGVTLFEMLTGRTPYINDNTEKEIHAHLYEDFPSLKSLIDIEKVESWNYVIRKCMNRNLKKRYLRDEDIINDIDKIRKGEKLGKYGLFARIFRKK